MLMIPSLAIVSRVSAGLNVCFKSYAENDAAFRARSLDAAKPLPAYRNRELPESNHCLSISLAFPQMLTDGKRTGIGKPSAESSIGPAGLQADEGKVIPLPEVEGTISYHDCLYKGEFQIPKQLIHNHTFGLESEQPDYDMDSEDGVVLNPVKWKMAMKKRRK